MGKKQRIGRCISTTFILIMILSIFSVTPVTAETSSTTKDITTHDIAIVFDNSGSMYDKESWSQALYAMEVFATMVDYDHDKLGIYPMGPISIGKGGKESGDRLDISSKDDVKNIERIYCEHTSETILAPAYSAYDYLMKSDADEVWMIVLTDGAFYYDKDVDAEDAAAKKAGKKIEEKSADWISNKLNAFSKDSGGKIKVQYLGFDEASRLSSNPSNNFFAARAASESDLTRELVGICNQIFQRDQLPDVSSDGRFSIDVSMKNMFAFVQGKGAKIKTLSTDGGSVIKVQNSTVLEASKEGGTNHKRHPSPVADVAGQMVEFGTCDAGSYQLDFTGSNVQIFYEPDVRIKTTLTDADGEVIDDFTEDVLPGEYTLTYDLVDRSGKSASGSPLLGNVVIDDAVVTNKGQSKKVPSGEKILLESDSETSISIEATYLNNYHISNESEEGIGHINVTPPQLDELVIKADVTQSESWYNTGDHDNWKPITVKVEYDGKSLSDELMKALKPEFKFSPELDYSYDIIPGESAFEINIGKDKNGEYSEPECGVYHFDAKVFMKDEYGQEASSNTEKKSFEVQNYPKFWKWLLRLIILAVILLLLWFILTRKAWPRKIVFVVEKPKDDEGLHVSVKPRSTSLKIVPYEDAISCSAKKNSTIKDWLFKPKGMSIVAYNFSSEEIRSFSTGGHTYTEKNGEFTCKGVDNEIIFNGTSFEFTFQNGTKGSGHIEIK